MSLLFYAFGAGRAVIVLILSILINYTAGRLLEVTTGKQKLAVFVVTTILNIGALLYYKYVGFLWSTANDLSHGGLLGAGLMRPSVMLPIGISFFTFQAMSYIADIYSGGGKPARSLVGFGMYHSLFPQLIAGPIVRYTEIEPEIRNRSTTLEMASNAATRFIIGLAKKIVIADSAGVLADQIFNVNPGNLSPSLAWLGAIAYSIQILFDFSGYSDMAIGLGLLMGFHFPENFNAPYRSTSVTEFWKRWHMTLSRWFRDYVYIPMGGNRKGNLRTYVNLFTVFFLCGFWHGAAYTFIIWGLYHGMLLIVERVLKQRWNLQFEGLYGHCWTMITVIIGWVFFRAKDATYALRFIATMSGFRPNTSPITIDMHDLSGHALCYLSLGILIALVPVESVKKHISTLPAGYLLNRLTVLGLFTYSVLLLSAHTFNPFIYFRF